jgi:hypothetical protein
MRQTLAMYGYSQYMAATKERPTLTRFSSLSDSQAILSVRGTQGDGHGARHKNCQGTAGGAGAADRNSRHPADHRELALGCAAGVRCHNMAALNDHLRLAVYLNGAKPHRRPAVSDQSLWFSKGEAGQHAFDIVFAAWRKPSEAGARSAVCQPS